MDSASPSVAFSLDPQPPVNWGGNDGAGQGPNARRRHSGFGASATVRACHDSQTENPSNARNFARSRVAISRDSAPLAWSADSPG